MAAKNKSNELTISRLYDAPRELVWDAWTDPEQVAKWWGPRGFTLTTHSKDLRVGGMWHYTMHGPDGTDYPNKTIYHEVVTHSRLVYDHGGYDDRPPLFRVTVTFTDLKGKTKMDMTMAFPSPEAAIEASKFIKLAGGHSTWDRLAEYLGKEQDGKNIFVINRSFAAPISAVFDMWAQPESLSQWLTIAGPAEKMEIKKPHNIVCLQHPANPAWPATMLTTVTLSEEAADQTRVTVTWEIPGAATAEETAAFNSAKGSMTQGWTASFDKLDDILAKNS